MTPTEIASVYVVAALTFGAVSGIMAGCVAWRWRDRIVREYKFWRLRSALKGGE